MGGVLVVGESADGVLSPITLRLVTAGATLSAALGEPLVAATVENVRPYRPEPYVEAVRHAIEASKASVVLFAHEARTRDWVPRLAATLGAGLATNCVRVAIEDGALIAVKPVNGGGVTAEYVVLGTPRFVTVQPMAYEPADATSCPEIVRLESRPAADSRVVVLGEETVGAQGGPRLQDAKTVVAGGRGIGGREHWHYIEEASAALGAAIACSRPVADSGWVPSACQVGLSGTSVCPDLYIAVGISGAAQHLAGITAARKVVAINTSADAEIFSRADYGVIGDYREVLPAFVERARALRKEPALAPQSGERDGVRGK